jgi:hypothetical protein
MGAPGLITAVIEFATPAMLGWAAAALTPFLINFWIRRRHVESPWAAMELLRAAVRERSRHIRVRVWLLLLMRAAILLLAALAAARPAWKSRGAVAESPRRTHHVIVIDQSASMTCRGAAGTRLSRAIKRARQVVEEAPAGDAFTVFAWAERAENVLGRATFDKPRALAAIETVAAVDTVADLGAALRAAATSIEATKKDFPELGRTQIIFLTDAAADTWAAALPKPAGKAPTAMSDDVAGLWASLQQQTEVVVESVDDGIRDNLAIAEVSTEPQSPLVGQPFAVNVRLAAFGQRVWQDVPVEVLLDGDHVAEKPATIRSGDNSTIQFEARVTSAGNHVIEARLPDDADALAADNRRGLSSSAIEARRVILFAEEAEAAETIARALNPRFREGAADGAISVELADAASLASKDLTRYSAVFLSNVAQLSEREQRLLSRYVEGGGALVIVLGPATNPAAFNQFFATTEKSSDSPDSRTRKFLPVELAAEPSTGDWRFDPLGYRHPIVAPFAGRTRAGLLSVRVSKYFPVRVNDESRVQVALRISSGDPAIVTSDFGLGRIALMTIDPSLKVSGEPWTTLAVSPSFVPLMRELFNYVSTARQSEVLNRLAGDALTLPSNQSSVMRGGQWESPDGTLTSLPPDARHAGVYRYRQRSQSSAEESREAADATAIAVNIDPRESDLETVDVSVFNRANSAGQSPADFGGTPSGSRPLGRLLLAAAIAFIFLELAAAWLLGWGWA